MELKKLINFSEKFISILIILVTCILFSISIYTLLSSIVLADAITNDLLFQLTNQFLQNALLFIIGLEIALTLIKHSFVNVIELLIFAMVRKILLASESSLDVVLVVLSIIALILVRNYIKKETMESLLRES
ncbi:MAG: hypothetical protein KKF16_02720 [Euryarchaeota archaeon]|nr:hypothetical protein [Euryarchaeota archaeon]MBU4608388.1 hypothetical protein [Euryarchaeota archaeon]MBV1728791.1 hypothetical protein [Methanobacterium sp.]MBV1755452.1 hypothetical protein [Methanobacterium sp.]